MDDRDRHLASTALYARVRPGDSEVRPRIGSSVSLKRRPEFNEVLVHFGAGHFTKEGAARMVGRNHWRPSHGKSRWLIFGPDGRAMTPQHARKAGRCYRMVTIKRGENDGPIRRVPAGPVDQAVVEQVRHLVRAPEIVARTMRAAGLLAPTVREALADFDRIWDELFPAEQARLIRLLVERVDVSDDSIRVCLRTEGWRDVIQDLQNPPSLEQAA